MGTEALRHAIAQEGLNGQPNTSGRWGTLCKHLPTPDPSIATAKDRFDVTCSDCARILVEMGCGTKWDVDPKLVEYLRQIANERYVFEKFVATEIQESHDEKATMGDRVAVRVTRRPDEPELWLDAGKCSLHLHREDMMMHRDPGEGRSWDWKVDPDAGITISMDHAEALRDALGEAIAAAKAAMKGAT